MDIRTKLFTVGVVVRHWNRLPKEVQMPDAGSVYGPAEWNFEQPDLVEGVLAQDKETRLDDPFQPKPLCHSAP